MAALRSARRARHARHRLARDVRRDARRAHDAATAASTSRWAHLGADNVRRQFKGMVERCADCGFDLAGGRVEVVPTAHYMMGGVEFAPDCTTELRGLFVAGEDSGGVHGANRLGGNGVANSTVFGGIAGDAMARVAARATARGASPIAARSTRAIARAEAPLRAGGGDAGGLEAIARGALRDDVGRRGHRARRGGPRARRRRARTHRRRARTRTRCPARRASARLQPDLARLAQPREPDRGVAGDRPRRAARARIRAARTSAPTFRAPGDLATSTYTRVRAAPTARSTFARGRCGSRACGRASRWSLRRNSLLSHSVDGGRGAWRAHRHTRSSRCHVHVTRAPQNHWVNDLQGIAMNRTTTLKSFLAAAALAFGLSAHAVDITGAGATFPYPIYAKWAEAYKKKTGIGMNYQSIGSGGGIAQIKAKTVDFGASDMPLKPDDLQKSGLMQFPAIIGGVVPVVNLEGIAPGALQAHRARARRHLSRQDQELERQGDRRSQSRRSSCRRSRSPSCAARTAPARRSSGPTTCRR